MRSSTVRNRTHRLIGKRIIAAQRGQEKKLLDPVRKQMYKRREKRWKKMLKYASDDTKSFVLGFMLGLIANETILMTPFLGGVEVLCNIPAVVPGNPRRGCTEGAYKDGPENIFFAKVDGPENFGRR